MSAILIVDNDDALRVLLRTICMRDGYDVVEARNGVEALAALSARRFDVVLLDLMMAVMSGGEVLYRLAEKQRCRRNVIVLTAESPSFTERLNRNCVYSVIRKPFDLDELLSTIHDAAQRDVLAVEDDLVHHYLIESELTRARYGAMRAPAGTKALLH